jgi:2-polyprenyl-3-methyl-5-hydroxy-6-metoxy-1,4-benzoquinol methylase
VTLRARLRGWGVALRVLPYRPATWTAEEWRHGYEGGGLDYFGELAELGRYSMIVGYLANLGGRPRVLDVGCGSGVLRSRLALVPFERYVGVDPTAAAIDLARRWEDDRTSFVVSDFLAAELPRFDVVVANEVLTMVPDAPATVDRIAGVVRPGGHVVTSIARHPGDVFLWRLLDARFRPIDAVTVRNEANRVATAGWRVACHAA